MFCCCFKRIHQCFFTSVFRVLLLLLFHQWRYYLLLTVFYATFPYHQHSNLASLSFPQTTFCCLLLPCLFIVYWQYYVFQRAFCNIRHFLPYTPFPHLVHILSQLAHSKAFLGPGTTAFKVAGFQVAFQNTAPVQLFV